MSTVESTVTPIGVAFRSQKQVALACARAGLAVVPHQTFVGPLTPNGVRDATTERAKIRQWWAKWPGALVRVVLGSKSNVIAVVTEGEAGVKSLKQFRAEESQKKTITLEDDDDEKIRLYRIPPNLTVRSQELARALRVLGEGDTIVLGKKHGFVPGRGVGDIKIAPAPQWLLNSLIQSNKGSRRVGRRSSQQSSAAGAQPITPPSVIAPSVPCSPTAPTANAISPQPRGEFGTTVQDLKRVLTRPISELVGVIDPLDLKLLAARLNDIAEAPDTPLK